MKFISTIIAGVLVGAIGLYFTLDWQEEKLVYSITEPAKFGKINYQNITLRNAGWNPAINIKVLIDHQNINFKNAQSKTTLKDLSKEENGIASIERVRRNESIVISLAYEGQPLFGNEITISSDRSIAEQIENEKSDYIQTMINLAALIFGGLFVIGILASIAIPAYNGYIEAAKKAKEESDK